MPEQLTVTVGGVRETLRSLQKIDPKLRRQTVSDIKKIAKPIQSDAQSALPPEVMRNWRNTPAKKGRVRGGKGWPAYQQSVAKKQIKLQFGGRASKEATRWRLLRLVQWDAAGSIFDIAGRKAKNGNGSPQAVQFMANLFYVSGRRASRTIWPAVEKNQENVTKQVLDTLRSVERTVQREINP